MSKARINAGKYNRHITIISEEKSKNEGGFREKTQREVLTCWAEVKTTRGYTLIASGSDFEEAYTNFTIRFPKVEIKRDMVILYNGKRFVIKYLNNVNEANIELEIQAKEVEK